MGLRKPPKGPGVDDFLAGAGGNSAEPGPSSRSSSGSESPSREKPRSSAGGSVSAVASGGSYPWEEACYSVERNVYVNLILDEVSHQKLKYVASNGPHNSANDFMRKVLLPALEKEIEKIEKMRELFANMD